MIRKADVKENDAVTELVRKTIEAVYPKYYPAGAVDFFLAHHKSEKIASDIEALSIECVPTYLVRILLCSAVKL